MAKWTCKCGNLMNDHNCPDCNYYLVFSDLTWDKTEPDKNENVNFYNLPDPDFDAYVCPSCGRLMLFGGNSNRCIFYKPDTD